MLLKKNLYFAKRNKNIFNFRTPSEWFKEYDPTNVAFNPAVLPPVKVPQRIPANYPNLPYTDVVDKINSNVNFSKDFF